MSKEMVEQIVKKRLELEELIKKATIQEVIEAQFELGGRGIRL